MKKGEFVARFSGEPLTHSQNEKRDSKYRLKIHNDLYLDGEGQHHLEGRYLNSSKGTAQRPNVRFGGGRRIHQCPHTGLMYCRMYATRDIAPDDEMLVPYGQSYWSAYPLQSETVDDNTSSDDDSDSEHGGTDGGDENSSDNEDDSNDEEHQPDGGDSCDCTNGSTDDEHRGTNNNGDKLEDITRDNEDPCDDACDNRNDKHDDAGNNTCDSDDDRPGLCSVTGSSDSESSSGLSCTSDDDSDYDHSETPGGPPKPCDDDSDYRHDEVLECFIVAAQPTTPDELSADGDTDGTPTSSCSHLDQRIEGESDDGSDNSHDEALRVAAQPTTPDQLSEDEGSSDTDETYEVSDQTDRSVATDDTSAGIRFTIKDVSQSSNSQLVSQTPEHSDAASDNGSADTDAERRTSLTDNESVDVIDTESGAPLIDSRPANAESAPHIESINATDSNDGTDTPVDTTKTSHKIQIN